MKQNYWGLFVLVVLVLLLSLLINSFSPQEGYHNYNDCLNKGFSKAFCVQTPWSLSNWMNTGLACQCENGALGQYLPGFGGDCICD
tara:strand:- start:226 stop:483 length:258 start_codon:yes stop_codon:yes gene_type:complete